MLDPVTRMTYCDKHAACVPWRHLLPMPNDQAEPRPPDNQEGHDMSETTDNSQAGGRCAPAPGSDASPWPARDVVAKLVEAADILLDGHNYDGHGHEMISGARRVGREWLRQNTERSHGGEHGI
jgi:hypothetical protein